MKIIFLLFLFSLQLSLFAQASLHNDGIYVVINSDSCLTSEKYVSLEYYSEKFCFKQEPDISIKDFDTLSTNSMDLNGHKIFSLNIKLTEDARKRFEIITAKNIGNEIALIVDNKIIIAPNVNATISSGIIHIEDDEISIKKLEEYLKERIVKKNY